MIRQSVCPIYDTQVYFCDDRAETLRLVNKLRIAAGRKCKEPDYYENADGACTNAGDALVFSVFVPELSIVAHEAIHAASKTLREAGITIHSDDDHECLTYLVEWYFNEWVKRMSWKVTVKTRKGWPK